MAGQAFGFGQRSAVLSIGTVLPPLVITGGCYFETCEAPAWRAVYGSGGRAAHALIGQTPVILHTYFPEGREAELYPLAAAGIDIRAVDCPTALAFAYFHPLSDPVLAPDRATIARQPSLRAEGEAVLRFGFVEGDAVVTGQRVVYDPQSVGDFAPFAQNGSSAAALALVLNTDEMRAATGRDDLMEAAEALLRTGAEVVIAKGGVHGAMVHTREASPVAVPAYWSPAVFKIGTGDVFSAVFAHAWAQLGQAPVEAARAASLSVASYTASRTLPLPPLSTSSSGRAVQARRSGIVHLVGSTTLLGDRWLFEEAAWRLAQLGVQVRRWEGAVAALPSDGACLLLADHLEPAEVVALAAPVDPTRLVLLSEARIDSPAGASVTPDFTTALYWACWRS